MKIYVDELYPWYSLEDTEEPPEGWPSKLNYDDYLCSISEFFKWQHILEEIDDEQKAKITPEERQKAKEKYKFDLKQILLDDLQTHRF